MRNDELGGRMRSKLKIELVIIRISELLFLGIRESRGKMFSNTFLTPKQAIVFKLKL